MKICVYNRPAGSSIGGCEYAVAVLAEALAQTHQVDIVHHRPGLTAEQLANNTGADLGGVGMHYFAPEEPAWVGGSNPWRRFQEAKQWQAALSEPYDLFINFTFDTPPFCHARRGVLVVTFPFFDRAQTWPWNEVASLGDSLLRKRLRRVYYDWEWRKRFDTYQLKVAISRYTQVWSKRWWGIDSRVVYPPSNVSYDDAPKARRILSVGRFTGVGHTKKQLEMVSAFRQMSCAQSEGWEYFCVGGLGNATEDRAYFEHVRLMGAGRGAQVLANLEAPELKRLYEQSAVFWHAAGYGEDDHLRPELAEHFGIVTVEAMAAGCVPVVINKGGQPEIVQHGVNGFLWNTLEELKEYTMLLARDEDLRTRMAGAARARARSFSKQEFVGHFLELLRPHLS